MKIATASSARGYTCQIERIEKGFLELGHELTPYVNDADLVYINNPWFDQAIIDKFNKVINGKVIFNVLDIPVHIGSYDYNKLGQQLSSANAVTSISSFVQKQVQDYCGIPSSVIYQPLMDVKFDAAAKKHKYKYLFIGRALDPNKRTRLGLFALQSLGARNDEIAYVGTEYPGFGDNLGLLTEPYLQEIYNSVDFVFCLGRIEGICLPLIEAMACGTIPLVCEDLSTREEFLPSSVFPEYLNINANSVASLTKFILNYSSDNNAMNELKKRLYNHYINNLQYNFSNVGVAQKILDFYGKII